MNIKRILVLFFVLLFSSLNAWAQQKPMQRIISLGPVITEELFLLESGDKLVGCTTYCQRPEAAKYKEKVGSVQEINLEKVLSLKPDVVLATELTDPSVKQKLRALGVRVVDIPNARNFSEICDVFLKLGQMVGQESLARTIIAESQSKVEELRSKLANAERAKVFVQVGSDPLVTVGGDTFADDFIGFAGGVNIVSQKGYMQYSREQVVASDPDVMLISSMGFDGQKEAQNWKAFKTLKAVAQHRIFIIDQYLLCSPTPVSFVETLKTVIHDLHPGTGL